MSRFYKLLSVVALSMALAIPTADARGRNNSGDGSSAASPQRATQAPQNSTSQHRNTTSDGKSINPTSQAPQKAAQAKPSSATQRPGNSGMASSQRPGNNGQGQGATTQRPGNNNQRPGATQRPGNSQQPESTAPQQRPPQPGGHNPGHGPGGPGYGPGPGGPAPGQHFGNVPPRPPYRPYMPANRPYRPPMPPANFRPVGPGPVISTILGVSLGTALNLSINMLINNGYAVTGYTNESVYLNNVYQLNLLWPNATLFYNRYGALTASEFVYSTPYYDMNRYNTAYRILLNNYGNPISTKGLPGGGVEVNWFGYDGQYVSLQFLPANAYDGTYRYYTTLSFGR